MIKVDFFIDGEGIVSSKECTEHAGDNLIALMDCDEHIKSGGWCMFHHNGIAQMIDRPIFNRGVK